MSSRLRAAMFSAALLCAGAGVASGGIVTNGNAVTVSGVCEIGGISLGAGQRLELSAGSELRLPRDGVVEAKGVSDVVVSGPGAIVGGGIRFEDARRSRVEGVRFEDCAVAVEVRGASGEVSVSGCRALRVSGAFLKVCDGAAGVSLSDCGGSDIYRGLWVEGVMGGGRSIRGVAVKGLALRGQTEYVLQVSYAEGESSVGGKATEIEGISMSDVSNERSVYGVAVAGRPDSPVKGVSFSNIDFGAVRWRDCELSNVEDIAYDGVPGLFGTTLCHDVEPLDLSFYDEVFKRVVMADRAADAAWVACDTPEKLKARQERVRAESVAAMGGFPERCPLNARVTGRIEKKGYAIEKVLFESRRGFHVSGHLFIPQDPRFSAPYPALLVPCGHTSVAAKWGFGYQRIGVFGARAGFAVLVYDPIDQGERRQKRDGAKSWSGVHEHNNVGVRATLLGSSQAAIRIWDGMRALDYLEGRPDVDRTRLGVLGISGGGTLSSNINAFDGRIRAGAPAAFLSTMRDVYDNCGPQDAEQQFFGQLRIGLNHLGLVCLRAPSPTLMVVSHDDFFPLMGSIATCERAKVVYGAAGNAAAVDMQDAAGPHHWYQSNQRASIGWMRRWLLGDKEGWTPEKGRALRFEDAGFMIDADNSGCAYDPIEVRRCAPGGRVIDLPGERSIYDILREELAAARSSRPAVTPEVVRGVTGIRPVESIGVVVCPASRRASRSGGFESRRVILQREDDMVMIPVVTISPAKSSGKSPVLVVGDSKRRFEYAAKVRSLLEEGRSVAVADLRGFGDTAKSRHSFYGASSADEEIAILMYTLGDSIVARRAEDISIVARYVRETLGAAPLLYAEGRAVIPAAHARYLDPSAFSGIETAKEPLSWSEVFADETKRFPFANCVYGAMRSYDWAELLK